MFDVANVRLIARRSKKYWVAALCAGSFACGHYLLGDDDAESLLSQYQQATQQLVTEVQPSTARRQGSATNANPQTSRLQPAKAQAASTATPGQTAASNITAPQQKSSRRVKPAQQPSPEAAVAKSEMPTNTEPPTKSEPLANAEPLAKAELPAHAESLPINELQRNAPSVENKAELVQRAPAAPVASDMPPAPAASESKPLPMVTYMPPQSEVTQKQLAPRMEIITPATVDSQSPRAQDPAAQNTPFVAAKPVPVLAEVRSPVTPQSSQPLPQIINVSRQAVAPPQPPKLASKLAELNDENLPPIVSPDQVPRPGTRKKQVQPAAQTTPVLRIDLSKK